MEEKEYSVSEAVRLIGVESHVLRYWEEELSLKIHRSAQGHRLYSEENIDTFRQIKELKEKGLQLKAIRLLLDGQGHLDFGVRAQESEFAAQLKELAGERQTGRSEGAARKPDSTASGIDGASTVNEAGSAADEPEILRAEIVSVGEPEPVQQFEQILRRLMEEVVSEQNERLEESITMRLKDELEEFYQQYEQIAREAAVALEADARRGGVLGRVLRRLFRRE